MKKLYAACWLLFSCVVYLTPTHEAFAYFPHGFLNASQFACPSTTNNWCIGLDGWTVFTASVTASGTCSGSSGTSNGTCAIAVDNTVAATFQGSVATGGHLTYVSGTVPTIGQTLDDGIVNIPNGITITGGTSPNFTLSGTGASTLVVPQQSMNGLVGNDATCTAVIASGASGVGIVTNANLSSFVPAGIGTASPTACATPLRAQALERVSKPDWIIVKKGTVWNGGFDYPTNDTLSGIGLSSAQPFLITAYGTGARPLFNQSVSSNIGCFTANATRGTNIAIVGIECYKQTVDPASPTFQGATFTADTGVANCGSAAILCNINGGVGLPLRLVSSASYEIDGSNLFNLTPTAPIGAGTTSFTMNGNAPYTATQAQFQLISRNLFEGISLSGPANFLLLEDMQMSFSGLSINPNTVLAPNSTNGATFYVIRRNMFSGALASAANIFWGPTCPNVALYASLPCGGVSMLLDQNVFDHGGWNPAVWHYFGFSQFRDLYLHNPSPLLTLSSNIVSNNSSDLQARASSNGTNNLIIANTNVTFNADNFNSAWSYNVTINGTDIFPGTRTASQADAPGQAVLHIPGIFSNPLTGDGTSGVVDVSNPGAIPNTTTISSIRDAFSVNLSGNIQNGIRGNGVQPGDVIKIFSVRGGGMDTSQLGITMSAGPATGGIYPGPSTVSVSAGGAAAVVTETAGNGRSNAEPFSFTSGSVPTGVSLSTPYCADVANGTSTAYPFYAANTSVFANGDCSGGGSDIVATGSGTSGVSRTGSRVFNFNTPIVASVWPVVTIPSAYTTVGTTVADYNHGTAFPLTINGATGQSRVQSFVSNILVTQDATTTAVAGASDAGLDGQDSMNFNMPNDPLTPTIAYSPNNLIIHYAGYGTGTAGAISPQAYTSSVNAGNNYIYNWDPRGTGHNIQDIGFPGSNNTTQIANVGAATFNGAADTHFPLATIEAYDAVQVNNTFTGTISGAATYTTGGSASNYDYATLTVSGGAPNLNDTIFNVGGAAGVVPYTVVLSSTGAGTYLITAPPGTLANTGPVTMMSGSQAHFIAQALNQSHEAGWNPVWTAKAANNYIRDAILCGNVTQWPTAVACPHQNFLLKRDLDPASNDNDPMWQEKAA